MKAGKTLLCPMIIVGILCIVAMIAGLIFMRPAKRVENTHSMTGAFFNYSNEEDLESAGITPSPDGSYKIDEANACGFKGTASVKVKESSVASVTFTTTLFSGELLTAIEAEDQVKSFVEAFSNEHGFSSKADPNIVQFTGDDQYKECPEDKYEALIQGYIMFERSYRDSEGILWILQMYSPKDNILVGSINKYPDDSGFADYVPQEIIQKEVVE